MKARSGDETLNRFSSHPKEMISDKPFKALEFRLPNNTLSTLALNPKLSIYKFQSRAGVVSDNSLKEYLL